MAHPRHLAMLRRGVQVWNKWRENNPDVKPELNGVNLEHANLIGFNFYNADLAGAKLIGAKLAAASLSGAKLSGANLTDANLTNSNLTEANLTYANLTDANFTSANLTGANLAYAGIFRANFIGSILNGVNLSHSRLFGSNLKGVNLSKIQALNTDFSGTDLTGVCIEAWNINSQTNLKNIQCDYIYLKANYSETKKQWIFTDRCPQNPMNNFASGEFAKLFQKTQANLDLTFQNDLDWRAIAYSLDKVCLINKDISLDIKKIENKGDGNISISLNIPENANKERIMVDFWQNYKLIQKRLEGQFQARVEDKDKVIFNLFSQFHQLQKKVNNTKN